MDRVVGGAAAFLGHLVRWVVLMLRIIPLVAAPLLVVYGVWLLSEPAAYIVAGVIVFVLSRPPQTTDRRKT